MSTPRPSPLLRYALLGDALASGATGLVACLGAVRLADPLGLPAELLVGAGLVLLPYAAFVAWLGSRPAPARPAVWAVVAVNAVWVLDSVLLLASGWVAPTALGASFVLLQAAAVAGFAGAQAHALRSSPPGETIMASSGSVQAG